jgi:hypothetical protein
MSISGILRSLSQNQFTAAKTPLQQSIQQLGEDLQSGNTSSAQSDFANLQQAFSQLASSTSTSNLVAQSFKQLASDVQSGNISASQKDLSTLQQDLQSQSGAESTQRLHHNHRMRYPGTGPDGIRTPQGASQPGQTLTTGSLSAVQQAYAVQGETALSAISGLNQAEPPVSGSPLSLEA